MTLRIGILAPPWVPVPPPAYGGTETVIDDLARALQARGHHVELFTVGESTCPVHRRWLFPSARVAMGDSTEEAAHVLAGYEALADMDIVHDHTVLGPLLAPTLRHGPPVVTTHHLRFSPEIRRVMIEVARKSSVVAISRAQARTAGKVPIRAVIRHGLDLRTYQRGPGDGGYLAFVGRMCADKGVDTAVRVAKRAVLPLIIASKMRTPAEQSFFRERVAPLLGPDDPPPQELSLDARVKLLRDATALVNPIQWPEPFGLVMIEALAAGTPVITRPCGAAPEIVDDGLTGFIRTTEDELVATVDRVGEIDRSACRAAAEERFSADRMAADYEELYYSILGAAGGRSALTAGLAPALDLRVVQTAALDTTG